MLGLYSSSIRAAMPCRVSSLSGLKVMTSSTRPKNSGRRNWLSALRLFSSFRSSSLRLKPRLAVVWSLLPALEVMQMTVLEKSTVRPWASLILPSSRICSRIFITSGWAFSISSNSTTLYGRRRTFSVS